MVMPAGGLENASGKRWEVGLNDEVEPSELGGGGGVRRKTESAKRPRESKTGVCGGKLYFGVDRA